MKNKIISIVTQMIFLCVIIISCDEQEYVGAAAVTNLPIANFAVNADKYQRVLSYSPSMW